MKMQKVETPREFAVKRKQQLASCDRCPWHRSENVERTPRKSWKLRSKRKRQFKTKGGE